MHNELQKRQELAPQWKQPERAMIEALASFCKGREDQYSASNWALWEIARLRYEVNAMGELLDKYEEQLENAQRSTAHIYQGFCPDNLQPNSRDPQCPVCCLIMLKDSV